MPEYAHTWIGMAETYRKRNDLKKAIAIMEEFKKTKWYQPYTFSDGFYTYTFDGNKKVTDNHIEDYTKNLRKVMFINREVKSRNRMEKIDTIKIAAQELLNGSVNTAKQVICKEYPFTVLTANKRTYTNK